MIWYHDFVILSWSLCLVPVLTLIIILAALGVGIGLAALNVAYRDFRYVIPFLVQFLMFATPLFICYLKPMLQTWVRWR